MLGVRWGMNPKQSQIQGVNGQKTKVGTNGRMKKRLLRGPWSWFGVGEWRCSVLGGKCVLGGEDFLRGMDTLSRSHRVFWDPDTYRWGKQGHKPGRFDSNIQVSIYPPIYVAVPYYFLKNSKMYTHCYWNWVLGKHTQRKAFFFWLSNKVQGNENEAYKSVIS